MFKTYETKPQMMVSVDGLPAVCHNLNCDYTYTTPTAQVTSFTFDEASKVLTLTGTGLPTTLDEIQRVDFAKASCATDATMTASDTTLTCTLEKEPTCGSHTPELVSTLGKIPNDGSIVATVISCTILSASPLTGLNLLGGDNITVTGTNFPHHIDLVDTTTSRRRLAASTSSLTLSFSDSAQTKCIPQTSTTTEIVCLTDKFDATAVAGATLSLSVDVNSQAVANTLDFVARTAFVTATTITPSSASPVLKTQLTVAL
jgi:hypothetical protein